MSDFLTAIGSLFTFLITQLGNVANFFTTTTIGQIILGVALFGIVANLVVLIINKIRN